jgi:hypothetical protein
MPIVRYVVAVVVLQWAVVMIRGLTVHRSR